MNNNSQARTAVVVYESIYGNTRSIAEAIGDGLGPSMAVEVVPASEIQGRGLDDISLVVAGGPTHGHGLSRPQLREAGVKDATDSGKNVDTASEGPWLREWFETIAEGNSWAASFDTRYDMPELITGHASKGIMKRLERHGFRRIAEPQSFLVSRDNHLLPGEAERARDWGVHLAGQLHRMDEP
jgi:Flavodoxin domain